LDHTFTDVKRGRFYAAACFTKRSAGPLVPAEFGVAEARQTPEKKRGTWGAKSRALPAHLGDVTGDLGLFFLELFPFCGRDRFVARGD